MAFHLTVDAVLLALVALLLAGPTPARALPPEPPLLLLQDEPRSSPRWLVFDGYEDVAARAQKQTDEQQQQRTGYGDALLSLASLGKAVVEAVGDWTPRMTRAFLREQRNERLAEGVYRNDKQAEQQQQQRTGYGDALRIGVLGMGTVDGWGHVLPSPSPSSTPSSEVYGTESWSYDSWWKEPVSEAGFSYATEEGEE